MKKSINRILKPLTLPSKNSAPGALNARYLESFPAESSEDVGANEDMFKSWVLEKLVNLSAHSAAKIWVDRTDYNLEINTTAIIYFTR